MKFSEYKKDLFDNMKDFIKTIEFEQSIDEPLLDTITVEDMFDISENGEVIIKIKKEHFKMLMDKNLSVDDRLAIGDEMSYLIEAASFTSSFYLNLVASINEKYQELVYTRKLDEESFIKQEKEIKEEKERLERERIEDEDIVNKSIEELKGDIEKIQKRILKEEAILEKQGLNSADEVSNYYESTTID